MTPAEFKTKWAKFSGKESAAYQEHFSDLCRLLAIATPVQADPTGNDTFCFQKRVVKDAEFFTIDTSGRVAHRKLDAAVAAAYGFPAELPDDETLTRLLALNLERAAEEAQAAAKTKPKSQRAKAVEEML